MGKNSSQEAQKCDFGLLRGVSSLFKTAFKGVF